MDYTALLSVPMRFVMKKVSFLVIISMIISGCGLGSFSFDQTRLFDAGKQYGDLVGSAEPAKVPAKGDEISLSDLEVFFTDPGILLSNDYSGGLDKLLAQAIDSARVSIDMAIYSINLWSIRNALIDAYHRGIQVRIIMESDNLEDDIPRELKSAGIQIIGDRREGLMHNKFVVIDKQDVWTGSANMTIGSLYYDNNNLVHLHSLEIANSFTSEFEEMYVRDMFGSDVLVETTCSDVMVGNDLVEIYFSPDDHVSERIQELIMAAQENIFFMAYSFTADPLGIAIVEKFNAGIRVEGIMDGGQVDSNTGTEFDNFTITGINVYKTTNEGLMHHKVIIIDQRIVITGSYNFSRSAEEINDENVIIIHSQEIAMKYLNEYGLIKRDLLK